MLNGLDAQASRFLADLARIQERSQRAERQISSGLRVETASDAPEQVGEILKLRTRVEMNLQTLTNLTRVSARVDAAEAAVREAVSIVERVRVLAAQTASTGVSNRAATVSEVRQLQQQLISLAGVSADGQFVFGGDGVTAPPYALDTSSANGVQLVSGAATNSMLVVDEKGISFSVSRTASELFDAAGSANVFQAVEDLAKGLANDSESEVQNSLAGIKSALDHLNQQLTFFGNSQNRVESAITATKKNSVVLRGDLSSLQDTDLPAAILELNAAKVHQDAALLAQSRIPRSTLFDYLG
jgi:flagellar hook-associated protein 3 FlgL